jgi:ribosomal protein S18 acetylase RimI-like enzyme
MTTRLTPLRGAPAGSTIAYRRFTGIEEIDGMGPANARLRAHVGLLEPINLDSMRHRYTHLVNSDPLQDCLIVTRDGATVGYGRVEWHDLVDGDRIYDHTVVVEPSAWGLGVAKALIGWCERRSREIAAGNPSDRRTWMAEFAFGGDTELEDALRETGYVAVRWDAEMIRPDLEHILDVPLADGYALRTPTEAELPAVFRMTVEAFAEHWGQHEAEEQRIDEWVDSPAFRLDQVVIAWKGDEPAAMVNGQIEARPDGSVAGLLAGVCTHPRHRRRGLARACIVESLRRLRDAGATSAYLGVDTDNQNRAYALYESCGFHVATSSASYRKPFTSETT